MSEFEIERPGVEQDAAWGLREIAIGSEDERRYWEGLNALDLTGWAFGYPAAEQLHDPLPSAAARL